MSKKKEHLGGVGAKDGVPTIELPVPPAPPLPPPLTVPTLDRAPDETASEFVTRAMETMATPKAARGLTLVIATGPGGISPDELSELVKSLEALGHQVARPYAVETDEGDAYVPDAISNISNIMDAGCDVGVLLCPDWSTDPASRAEVFAAINMDRKLYAVAQVKNEAAKAEGYALLEISHWAALATLAGHQQFLEAAAIYAPLPKSTG